MRDMAIVIQISGGEPHVSISATEAYEDIALASMTGEALYQVVATLAVQNNINIKQFMDLVHGYMDCCYQADYELEEA